MPQEPRRSVFELEINLFDQQVDGDERFASFPLAQDGCVVADSQDQVRGLEVRRPIANAFYEVELALHLSGWIEPLAGPFVGPLTRSNIVFLDEQIQRLSNQRRPIEIRAKIHLPPKPQ